MNLFVLSCLHINRTSLTSYLNDTNQPVCSLTHTDPVHAAILLEKIEELDWTLRKQDYVGSALKCMDPSCKFFRVVSLKSYRFV